MVARAACQHPGLERMLGQVWLGGCSVDRLPASRAASQLSLTLSVEANGFKPLCAFCIHSSSVLGWFTLMCSLKGSQRPRVSPGQLISAPCCDLFGSTSGGVRWEAAVKLMAF